MNKVKVYRVRTTAKLPNRAHRTDAGMDFFYCPDSEDSVTISPGESRLLPTGLKMEVPRGCMLQVMNKSGIASKRSLIAGACVVDEGYTGEIFVNLHNIGSEIQTIHPGHKVAQGVFIKIENPALLEVTSAEELYGGATDRGSGALGSTGNT